MTMPHQHLAVSAPARGLRGATHGAGASVVLEGTGTHWKANGLSLEERRQPSGACCATTGLPGVLLVAQVAPAQRMHQRWAGRSHTASAIEGDLSLVPAHTAYDWSWSAPAHSLHLWLEPSFLAQAASAWWRRPFEPAGFEMRDDLLSFRDSHLLHLLRLLRWELHSSLVSAADGVSALRVAGLAQRLTAHLFGGYSNLARRPADPGWLRRGRLSREQVRAVVACVDMHLEAERPQAPSLDELARVTRLDRFWFAKLFRHSFGVAPHQYYAERRLERARTLLHDSRLTLAEIAAQAGFADQAHLTRQFQRRFEIAPGQMKKQMGKKV